MNEINQSFVRYQDKDDKIILDGIKSTLSNDKKKVLNKLNNDKIQEILESKKFTQFHLDYANDDRNKKLLYCKNCDIITKNFINKLKEIDKDIKKYYKEINCIFDKNKIIILLNILLNQKIHNHYIMCYKYMVINIYQIIFLIMK